MLTCTMTHTLYTSDSVAAVLHDFVQHVAQPTHKAGHTLDLLITRNDTTIRNLRIGC